MTTERTNHWARWVAIGAILACSGIAFAGQPVRYESFKRGKVLFHAVYADMRSDRVSAETVHTQRLSSLASMLNAERPVAAVTGTFFSFGSQRPVADVLVDGTLVASGERGSVLAVDWQGRVHILDSKFNSKFDWSEFRYALRGAVRIVANDKVAPNPKAQKFKDSGIWGRAARVGVGTTAKGNLVILATKGAITLSELGHAMRSRGATNAVSLDGGGSTCMVYRGSLVVAPNRMMSNMFVLYERAPRSYVRNSAGSASDATLSVQAKPPVPIDSFAP